MASHFDDPSQWRLTNFSGGDVPIKYLGLDGGFAQENGSTTVNFVIPASRLVEFLLETFPTPIQVGNISVPQSLPLPGVPGMVARKVSFKAFIDGLPCDPFGFDTSAPEGTYSPVIGVDVEYGPRVNADPNPNDPRTFLEISANTSGEFISTTAPKAKWKLKTRDTAEEADSADTDEPTVDPDTEKEDEKPATEGETETQKDPTTPVLINVPQTEWTIKWNQIPFTYFNNVLIHRVRWCLGRVNYNFFPLLHNAYPETILFTGYNYTQSFSWRDGNVNSAPINLEMKMLEKRVVWNGVICGHNHFWRPGKGWEYLLIDGVKPTYEKRNLNMLFKVT